MARRRRPSTGSWIRVSLSSFREWVRGTTRDGSMPIYDAERLSDAAIEEIYAYLRRL